MTHYSRRIIPSSPEELCDVTHVLYDADIRYRIELAEVGSEPMFAVYVTASCFEETLAIVLALKSNDLGHLIDTN